MLEELKNKITLLDKKAEEVRRHFNFDEDREKIASLAKKMAEPGFWDSQEKARAVIRELKQRKARFDPWQKVLDDFNEVRELSEMVEEKDTASLEELNKDILRVEAGLGKIEFQLLLSGEHDSAGAILSIHAGAGGTESCDWAAMLLRMYRRWAETKKYQSEIIDYLPGEGAGVKSVTATFKGDYAYGYLKAEAGVHRLVRISPFDANSRRHTSFASVDVIPEIEEDINIEIKDADIRVDVYRATGPGGQGVNTTDSAVRLTHLPSGIVVQCQKERSQIQNRATALRILKSRLWEEERKKREEKLAQEHSQKREIAWGSQIRSYVLHPYSMIKDHRTGVEAGNTRAVLDGKIDNFIEAYLKNRAKR